MEPTLNDPSFEFARFAVEHTEEGLLWIDEQGHLLFVNTAAGKSLGWSREELLAKTIFDVSPELTSGLWSGLWKEIRQRGTVALEFTLRARDARLFPVELSAHHLASHGKDYACLLFKDIQERKRLEQLKDEFVSTVSHELRTPMTIIREGVSQVLEGLRGQVTEEQRRALSIAMTGIERLARLVNELLDVSKIESGKVSLKRTWVDLVGLVEEIRTEYVPVAHDRGLEIRARSSQGRIDVYADRDRLIQVLTNLIDNALKFTARGWIEVALQEGPEITCTVSDTGSGIRTEDLSRIFHKFEQLGNVAVTGDKGSGLGLSICKGLVELHGGRIWAESEVGKGSWLRFTLPRRTVEDYFRQQIQERLREAKSLGASLSVIVFDLFGPTQRQATRGQVDRLEQCVISQSGRKTDILMKNTHRILFGLPSTVKKEALRLAEKIRAAFLETAEPTPRDPVVNLAVRVTSYPEDVPNAEEFVDKALMAQ